MTTALLTLILLALILIAVLLWRVGGAGGDGGQAGSGEERVEGEGMRPCAGNCGRVVSETCEWCARCVRGMTMDVRRLQGLAPGQLVILADIFSTVGADTLTRMMVGALPFDNRPSAAELDRLTDE